MIHVMTSCQTSTCYFAKHILCVAIVLSLVCGTAAPDDTPQPHATAAVFHATFSVGKGILVSVPEEASWYGTIAAVWNVDSGTQLIALQGHRDPILAVALSPDNKRVLTGGGSTREVDVGKPTDCSVRLWDRDTGREIQRFEGHTDYVHTVQFSRDGSKIITAGNDFTARVWDVETGHELFRFSHVTNLPPPPIELFDSKGTSVIGQESRRITVWDVGTRHNMFTIERQSGSFSWVEFSPNGAMLLTASGTGTINIWDAQTGQKTRELTGHSSHVHQASFLADGKRIAVALEDGGVGIWDVNSGNEVKRFENPGHVSRILIAGDGIHLFAKWSVQTEPAMFAVDGASLWNIESGKETCRVIDNVDGIVGFTPDGRRFILADRGRPVSLWDTDTGERIRQYE